MNRLDDMNAWRIFCEIVRSEGLNAAADRLGIEASTASRAVRALEAELDAPLFSRASRPVTLTELGRAAFEKASLLTGLHNDMIGSLMGDKDTMSGLIRVTSHAGIGPAEITPALVEFQKIYPDIQFELRELSATLPEGFTSTDGCLIDVAIGYGESETLPGIIMRYSGEMPFIPCASQLYVQRHGLPYEPEDCLAHTGIMINSPTRTSTSLLQRKGQTVALKWRNTLIVHNLISAKSAMILGAGIVPDMPLYHCADDIEKGTVIPVLNGWHRHSLSCYVFAREEAYEKRRIRVFVEWIAERERQALQRLKDRFPQFYRTLT